jgi:uncharacterized protein YbbC (DUF1343 family)
MHRYIKTIIIMSIVLPLSAFGQVRTGLDVLSQSGFRGLDGKRVGLVINHTAVDKNGVHILELIKPYKHFKVVRLFTPEHGLDGILDDRIKSGTHEEMRVPIFSLYGEQFMPTPESMADLDMLIFDIQDIGTRFYTYIITMDSCMRAAKAACKPIWVLDRPNTIGGLRVAGPVLETSVTRRFHGPYALPTQHGMSIGELALMFNRHFGVDCRLTVIKMDGWSRGMLFDQTGLPWVNPSPNMRSLEAALLYPGMGVLETGNFSVGRGTPTPFEVYGAPWLKHEQLCATLNEFNLPGVSFTPITFVPDSSKHKGKTCNGFRVTITDRGRLDSLWVYLHVAREMAKLHPKEYKTGRASGHIGASNIVERIYSDMPVCEIEAEWRPKLDKFKKAREKYLLYR